MSEGPVTIDRNHLDMLQQAIGDDFKPLIPAYLEQSDNLIYNLIQSHEQKDMEIVIRSAHSLKSSSYNLGAFQLSDYSRLLEAKAMADDSHLLLKPLIEIISAEYQNVKQELLDYYNNQ